MTRLLDTLPYARLLGLRADGAGEAMTVVMPFDAKLVGNPHPVTLHGGSLAALLELTAMARIADAYPGNTLPKPINVTVTYLRAGRGQDVQAMARIYKAGKRVVNVQVEAWQDSRDRPIAALSAHFLIDSTL
jgi:uncharacterized domain 1